MTINSFPNIAIDNFCEKGFVKLDLPTHLISTFENAVSISKKIHSSKDKQKKSIFCGLSNGVYGYSPSCTEIDNYYDGIPEGHVSRRRNYSSFDFGTSKITESVEEQILYSRNRWPSWLNDSVSTDCLNIYESIHDFLTDFLFQVFIKKSIKYEKEYFYDAPGVLRFMRYPDPRKQELGIPPHTDYEFLTLSYSTIQGFEVINRDGGITKIIQDRNTVIIQAGDCLEKVTNGEIKAPTHQVHQDCERYSIIHFVCSKPNIYIGNGEVFYSETPPPSAFCPSDHLLEMNVANNFHLENYVNTNDLSVSIPKDRRNPFNKSVY